ncbi:oligosaccharyl transferase, archaeosortase A system-associated [Halobacteria archaeon HArc-gm2]|nr:oligosaccharyl transferase, archaeosortase A system-associated [Halobacteria archaeon HArc-gm2]
MSQWRGRLEENPELESAADWVTANYHIPVVALLLAFMLWNRLRSVSNFVVDGEVLFHGNDAWYHYRSVSYTVRNWPATMPFDPWTYFPYGNASGQFGTLFDQIIATAALVVGLGSPSDQTVALTVLVAPAFFAAAAGIPTYVIGRRLGGRIGGITAVTVLAFSVGSFFNRSRVGFADHHVAEALFQALGILAVMVAITAAHREKPIYEQVVERDFGTLRPTLLWSALAGFAITLYLWVWPFGVLLIGIVGVFLLVQMCLEVLRGESPEHTAFAGAVMLAVTGVTILPSTQTATLTASDYSILHPLLAFAVAGGCVFMAWLAREWEDRDLDRTLYPVSVGGIIAGLVLLTWLVLPGVIDYFVNQFLRIFGLGFTTSQTGGTVGEVQPLVNWERQGLGYGIQQLFDAYGFALFLGFLGGLVVLARHIWDDHIPAEQLLIVVWLAFMTATTFTQARFQYYLVFPLAVLTGYAVSIVVGWIDLELDGDVTNIEAYQALTIVAILLVILVPIAPTAVAAGSPNQGFNHPDGDIRAWSEGLGWMEENTPEEGAFNGSDGNLDYYGTYSKTDDYDYAQGEYGVLSWWDYGHWITTIGERIPNANPFQQGTRSAANFLIAPNETQANDVLDEMDEDDAKTRYVVIDYKMVDTYSNYRGKFFAPTQFYDEGDVTLDDYTQRIYYNLQNGAYFRLQSQEFYNTTAVRLYQHHGSAVEPEPYVIDWSPTQVQNGATVNAVPPQEPNSTSSFRQFDSMADARAYVANDSSARIGGIGGKPSQRVEAMEHYRLVGASDRSATTSNNYNRGLLSTGLALFGDQGATVVQNRANCNSDVTVPQRGGGYACLSQGAADFLQPTEPRWTKVFERVPGATIEGTGPADTTVRGQVEMQMPGSDETFTYHQVAETDENGEFTMTVPYSTTGYDEWGPDEGHTNVSVRANSSYQFQTATQADNGTVYSWSGTTDVSEGQVIGKDDSVSTVDMERSELFNPNEQGNESDGSENVTAGNETDGSDGDSTSDTSGDETTESGTDANTTGSLVPAARD